MKITWKMAITAWIATLSAIVCVLLFSVCEQAANAISTTALVATLATLIWYSWETHSLRLIQERDVQIRQHPWLVVRKVESKPVPNLVTGRAEVFHLEVQNQGTTPAYDVKMHAYWMVESEEGPKDDDVSLELGVILPNALKVLDESIWGGAVGRVDIKLEVQYKDFMQGGGKFEYHYETLEQGNPVEKCDCFSFWLPDGTRFPERKSEKG